MIIITKYENKYKDDYYNIVKLLWEDVTKKEINKIIDEHHSRKSYILLAVLDDQVVGFLNSSIRSDYVEGSDDEKTGYIEGIFIKEKFRQNKIAVKLLNHLISYYRSINIFTIGSDAFVDNQLSDLFHKAVGFEEVSINRHYLYKINNKDEKK